MMQQRRGGDIKDGGRTITYPLSMMSKRTNGRNKSLGWRNSRCNAFQLLLMLCFALATLNTYLALIGVDYYQQPKHDHALSSSTNSRVLTTNENYPFLPTMVKDVVKPTSTNVTTYHVEEEDGTYEPTSNKRAYRVRSIKRKYIKESNYWKTHYPDPIPQLPIENDIDPITNMKLPPIIAYVTTLTSCNKLYSSSGGLDGAAILLHSIRRNSYGWIPMTDNNDTATMRSTSSYYPKYGGNGGRYRYRAYVFVDPSASPTNTDSDGDCARYLQKIGWIILHRASLVPLFDLDENSDSDQNNGDQTNYYKEWIKLGSVGSLRPKVGPTARFPGEHIDKLRMAMADDGCCGYKELLKLHVYGLVQHELAVHLDFDSLLLRPMDDLFDVMLGIQHEDVQLPLANLPQTRNVDYKHRIDAAFTRDYNSVLEPSTNAHVGYQGGFLVVKPDLKVLERYRTILRRGEFLQKTKEQKIHERKGWGGKHGGFYGDLTFQGILPYYYEDVAPSGEHNEIELDRCIFNQMADNPRKSTYKFPRATPLDPDKMGFHDTPICRDGRVDCSDTDCQRTHPGSSVTTHFTFCKKPWDCPDGNAGTAVQATCLGLLNEWYRVRYELEDWRISPMGGVTDDNSTISLYWKEETMARVHESRLGLLLFDNSSSNSDAATAATYLGYCDKVGSEGYRQLAETDVPRSSQEMQLLLGPAYSI